MKKGVATYILIGILIIFVFALLYSFDPKITGFVTQADSETSKTDSKVLEELQTQEEVRVIIELEEKTTLQKIFNVDTKKQVIESLDQKLKHEFEDSVSAEISESDLVDLEKDKKIKSVLLVPIKKIFLEESVPLVNATKVWPVQFDSINLTGAGETVCVLDTGVDFTHPDLTGKNLTCVIDCFSGSGCFENCSAGDFHGHGTHVAGTVAANGALKGVAPDANLIGVKVCGPSGCPDDDIRAGIDWCVNNASQHNISVISMSLGSSTLYNSHCDNVNDPLNITLGINNAVGQNISVVVATGNDGNATHIASPACIQNSTSVGSVYDANVGGLAWGNPVTCTDSSTTADQIVCHSNRNNMTDLFASGALINSSYTNGGYAELGGTSMATPHVSGIFALISQFKKLELGKILTPFEIKNSLVSTGKQVFDSSSGLTFSRVDVYSAVLSLDEKAPSLDQISPQDNASFSQGNMSFKCNATDELQLANLTLNVWNSTGLYYQNTTNASENSLETEFNISLTEDNYTWNCLASDKKNNKASTSNFSLTIGEKSITLSSPGNNIHTNQENENFTCSSFTDSNLELENMTFKLWNSTEIVHAETKNTTGSANETTFNFTFSKEGEYLWNCLALDNSSVSILGESNFSLTYDVTKPNINLTSPVDNDAGSTGTTNIIFKYNLSEANPNECSLVLNNETDQTNESITEIENEFSKELSPGNYNWSINCNDLATNSQNSETRSLTINSVPATPISSSGGGGGGGGSRISQGTTHTVNDVQVKEGVKRTLKKNDQIKFNLDSESHTLKINSVSNTEASLTISSDPITIILKVNETRKLNLDNDDYLDLEVFLASIISSKAEIKIKEIREEIPVKRIFKDEETEESQAEEVSAENNNQQRITGFIVNLVNSNKKPVGFGFVFFVVIITAIALIRIRKKKLKKQKKP